MTDESEQLRAIRGLRSRLQDHILDHEPPTSDREWGTIDGLEIAIEETMKLDEKIELRAMTDESETDISIQSQEEYEKALGILMSWDVEERAAWEVMELREEVLRWVEEHNYD